MRHVRVTRADDGFSLVELLVVTVIIGVLTSIALPSLASQKSKARSAALKANLRDAALAQEARATGDLPYAGPGQVDLLLAEGYDDSPMIVLTIVDGQMTEAGDGFCLTAHTVGLDDALYYASTGPHSGHPTEEPCTAS
ncbi:MAG TPA: prepilin-type N-terminal cleavage/methylation domain-containing protein [Mycobacteriales bacterium]|jgi:prepilin-type N-terminal cleavage/methylation domain-containing protein|nr:prepilin-type N-terminal cleavage/methylation domain-containing protein [Mycobacteriales bacterium]